MKKPNSICDYIPSRNEALKREFFNRLNGDNKTIMEVFGKIAGLPAPRFYISEERALLLLKGYYATGCWPERITANKRRMMEDIRERVEALMEKEGKMKLVDAVYAVVNTPAPSFYLTKRSIRTLLYGYLSRA